MIRFNSKYHSVLIPDLPVQYNGYNAPNAMNFTSNPGALLRTLELKGGNPNLTLRFPGGTSANFTHPTGDGYGMILSELTYAPQSVLDIQATDSSWVGNHLARQVAFAQSAGANVIFVANQFTGTPAEAVQSVQAFLDGGVSVIKIELGNEWYLPRYTSKYTDHVDYIAEAKIFRDILKAEFPTIPISIVVCPSVGMKDPDAGPSQNSRLTAANVAIRALTWPDEYSLHSYADVNTTINPYNSIGADNQCAAHRVELAIHVGSFSKPVNITEWNVSDGSHSGNTDTQVNHYIAMRAYFKTEPKISAQIMHSLMSAGAISYSAIRSLPGGSAMNRIGNLGKLP